jgi:hypothetical protein
MVVVQTLMAFIFVDLQDRKLTLPAFQTYSQMLQPSHPLQEEVLQILRIPKEEQEKKLLKTIPTVNKLTFNARKVTLKLTPVIQTRTMSRSSSTEGISVTSTTTGTSLMSFTVKECRETNLYVFWALYKQQQLF